MALFSNTFTKLHGDGDSSWFLKRAVVLGVAALVGLFASAATIGTVETRTWNEASIQVYAINVSSSDYPRSAPYALTSEEVSALVASGLPLWKEGTGSVSADGAMSSFDGDIYVVDGIYKVTALNALGTTVGATYVNGGTLECGYTGDWSWSPPDATFGMENLFVAGEGVDGLGAIYASTQSYKLFGGTLTLTGDTLLTGNRDVSMRCQGSTFNGGGKTLTVTMNSGNLEVMNGEMTNLLAIVVTKGSMSLAHGLTYKSLPGTTVTMKRGTMLKVDGIKSLPSTLVMEDGTRLASGTAADRNNMYAAGDLPGLDRGAGYATNVWAGPVVLQGAVTNKVEKGRVLTITGPVSGPGRFVGGDGGYIRLVNAGNTFTGPTAINGVVEDGATVGGLELINTNTVAFVQPNPVVVTNASMGAFSWTSGTMTMGDLAFHGQASLIGNSNPGSATTASSLLKTGAGTLTISRPVAVSGATEIREGTLKLEYPCGGLEYWTYTAYVAEPTETTATSHGTSLNIGSYGNDRAKAYQAFSNNYTRVGIDSAGARMSFTPWKGNELVFSHHVYAGEIFVSGSEPATWNFASRFQRGAWIEIDGTTVFDLRDIILYGADGQEIARSDYGKRLLVGQPVTLSPGWHSIFISLGNYWGNYNYTGMGPCGLYNGDGIYWAANMGVVLNKSGTCTSNSADYVMLKDPGDGSFLRISEAQKQILSPSEYRPVFNGPVTFGSGTVFDIGDSAPFVPVSVSDTFTGCPEVRNGILELSGEWVLDEAAIAADLPLRVTGGAGISFAAGARLTLPDDTAMRPLRNKVILSADASSTISGRENLVIICPGVARARWSDDGKTLSLAKAPGFIIFVR